MEKYMNARRKLNAGYWQGSFVIAGLIGWVSQSTTAFVVALVALLVGCLWAGDIRPRS